MASNCLRVKSGGYNSEEAVVPLYTQQTVRKGVLGVGLELSTPVIETFEEIKFSFFSHEA